MNNSIIQAFLKKHGIKKVKEFIEHRPSFIREAKADIPSNVVIASPANAPMLPAMSVQAVQHVAKKTGASDDDDEYLAYWEVINPDTLNKVVLYNLAAARKNPSVEFPEYAISLLENKTPSNSLTLIYLDSVQQVFNGGEFSNFEKNIRILSKDEKQECWRSANSRRRDVMSRFSRDENDGTLS